MFMTLPSKFFPLSVYMMFNFSIYVYRSIVGGRYDLVHSTHLKLDGLEELYTVAKVELITWNGKLSLCW